MTYLAVSPNHRDSARMNGPTSPHGSPRRIRGFGLVDALVALTLLALTLLGALGSLHFAMRATRAAGWQVHAVDLVADLDEALQSGAATDPLPAWQARVQHDLPAGAVRLEPRVLAAGASGLAWHDARLTWNAMPGQPTASLSLPVSQARTP